MAAASTTTIDDLPDVILSNIISTVTHTRSRNSISLVNRKFYTLERATRTSLSLRGNVRDLYRIPLCYRSVKDLDLTKVSPWGHPILSLSAPFYADHLAQRLSQAFPLVESLTIHNRIPGIIDILLPRWPRLRHVKLVRWHERPPSRVGAELVPVFKHCESLTSLDLSNFYFWPEDVPPALTAYPHKSANLTCLNLLATSLPNGFYSQQIGQITASCPNLNKFLVACTFDGEYYKAVSDETLTGIATNCPKLSLLHLAEISSLAAVRGNPDDDGFTAEDAMISREGLIKLFSGLPLLEELVLDVGKNVRDSGLALEELKSKCVKLKVLKLGQFHGVCLGFDGVALFEGLESLSIKNCGDLSDTGLIAIGRGCCRLAKFEVEGCKNITCRGLKTLAGSLRKTLVEVKISCCKQLGALTSCNAMEPIADSIQKLHIDCVWDWEQFEIGTTEDEAEAEAEAESSGSSVRNFDLNELYDEERDFRCKKRRRKVMIKTWKRLKYLSLWIEVAEFLKPLPMVGLQDCPELEEICIKVEGDTRLLGAPDQRLGLSSLRRYPRLSKLKLDLGDTIGYALTAPDGAVDLTAWDRFFLDGIGNLRLEELDYSPAFDRDINLRSLTMPAAGFIFMCNRLRKLFVHGTAQEHSMMICPHLPNVRDVQLIIDYYPAPDLDSFTTELRIDSYLRLEAAINNRRIDD
ncbi:F-box protein MAX2 [Melia azedarach]|uniref:F-box protein MAX2 n=1 Tax=Melia azedarach TaxID=155640 RepID=A0ACC1XTG2_MELAZ|nr:F-box protein MAX2 [Melia azedarach]